MNMKPAAHWIDQLQLQAHPEGGFYRETYRSEEKIEQACLPSRFRGTRSFCTSIYFLLRKEDRSLFHRIQSDELWHWHAGGPLIIYVLNHGDVSILTLGPDIEKGESLQAVVPANCWFGACMPHEAQGYTLTGCTVSPGFDFSDFELASRKELLKTYSHHRDIIEKLTRED
jgi:uncharacterized protein